MLRKVFLQQTRGVGHWLRRGLKRRSVCHVIGHFIETGCKEFFPQSVVTRTVPSYPHTSSVILLYHLQLYIVQKMQVPRF